MHKIRLVILLIFFISTIFGQTGEFAQQDEQYHYYINLNETNNDELEVTLIPPIVTKNEILFRMPSIVPGTYKIYDYGRFVSDLKAYDKNGNELNVSMTDSNSWDISKAPDVTRLTYKVHDTWNAKNRYNHIFEPAGTNFEKDKNFVLNGFGLYGYFDGMKDRNFEINITKPENFYGSTALIPTISTSSFDRFSIPSYFELSDSPIMYDVPDTVILHVGGADVLVSIYSPNNKVTSKFVSSNIEKTLNGQKEYLGGTLPIKKYAYIMYFVPQLNMRTMSFGALEHNLSSVYYTPELDTQILKNFMNTFTAHEFFHIITPLSIHSEEIGNFDFNNPKMSEHLWLYEGVTEYSAGIMQVKEGLITQDAYFDLLKEKIDNMERFNDTLPFTEMSKYVLDKFQDQYSNVYEKGAIIGMCLDIKLRDWSDGKYGIRDLLKDLSKKYGRNNSFKDDELFSEISSLTNPGIENFLNMYVAGSKPLPLKEIFDLAGVNFYRSKSMKGYTMGGIALGLSDSGLVVVDTSSENAFGKKMGYKNGDKIIKINGEKVKPWYLRRLFAYFDTLKDPEDLSVEVLRKDNNGDEKDIELRQKMFKVDRDFKNVIEINPNPTSHQLTVRNSWLGGP